MTRWLSSFLLVGTACGYELVPADLEKPVPPFVSDIESHKLELPFTTSASESRRCVHAFTARGRRHKGGRIDPGAYDGIAGNRQNARSSHNEDRFAIRLFGGAGNWTSSRTFLEIGAFDGVTESNTIIMERCLGWRGVLVEPNPRAFDALKAAGRTHSTLVHASPMCETESEVPMSPLPFTSARTDPEPGAPHGAVPVPCVSLTDILLKAGHSKIDFFSLDVENSEDRVLATLDLKKVDVALVFAEAYNKDCRTRCAKRDRVREYMAEAGYALNPGGINVHFSDVFVREDLMGAAEARRLLFSAVVR
uniref:Methyltransferase FkbM domain-containing protein n=1 Tax=Pelagomonas calceolata TaxID=35677 RepID=A0A7S3ZQX4_9STRA|mmetsp:Transcript_19693/g.60663  ORF Transcript_19693/g.60663 Transcript_19693/m.60663 type:complete len:307 (+) Transcript_19693:138-1058(+)